MSRSDDIDAGHVGPRQTVGSPRPRLLWVPEELYVDLEPRQQLRLGTALGLDVRGLLSMLFEVNEPLDDDERRCLVAAQAWLGARRCDLSDDDYADVVEVAGYRVVSHMTRWVSDEEILDAFDASGAAGVGDLMNDRHAAAVAWDHQVGG